VVEEHGLQPLAERLWVETRKLRFLGVETGTRMTVVKLDGGGLFVHSPVSLREDTRTAVDALGAVEAVVASSGFHHLYVSEWSEAYPDAKLYACPGLERKRDDVAWDGVLGDEPEATWQGQLDQVFFGARKLESEVVFFHRASGTLVCSDLLFHLDRHPSALTRFVARVIGNRGPSATRLERLMIRDRAAAREQVDHMLAWKADRIVLAHGEMVETGGHDVLRSAFAWL
jgi:hypothetical protein